MLLDLTLTPNRSLGAVPTRWLIGGVGLFFFVGGLRFLALGAWPVIPFMVADVALLVWAFRANNRAGRGHERVRLAGDELTVERVSPWGQARRWRLEPLWVRVEIDETPLGDAHLFLRARTLRLRVGAFLSAPERREVGAAIEGALRRYRQSPSTSAMA